MAQVHPARAKRLVEDGLRVAHVVHVNQAGFPELRVRLRPGRLVDQNHARPGGCNLLPLYAQVGDRLPCEYSTEVAKQDKQERLLVR